MVCTGNETDQSFYLVDGAECARTRKVEHSWKYTVPASCCLVTVWYRDAVRISSSDFLMMTRIYCLGGSGEEDRYQSDVATGTHVM